MEITTTTESLKDDQVFFAAESVR